MVYFIATIYTDLKKDRTDYEVYIEKVKPIVEHFGGRYLARTDKVTALSKKWNPERVVLIEWESWEQMERPIPNFYTLVKESVKVDTIVEEGNILLPEEGITMKVLYTSGHSLGHTSYIFQEEAVIFSGDAIPDVNDFPIFVDEKMSEISLEKMEELEDIQYCCPAWDRVYKEDEWKNIIKKKPYWHHCLKCWRHLLNCLCLLLLQASLIMELVVQIKDC